MCEGVKFTITFTSPLRTSKRCCRITRIQKIGLQRGEGMKRVGVFCGSRTGTAPVFVEQTRALGLALVRRGWGLVFGAGHIGLMGVLADAVRTAGGETIGVIPQSLVDRELADQRLTELRIVESMHDRKALM